MKTKEIIAKMSRAELLDYIDSLHNNEENVSMIVNLQKLHIENLQEKIADCEHIIKKQKIEFALLEKYNKELEDSHFGDESDYPHLIFEI